MPVPTLRSHLVADLVPGDVLRAVAALSLITLALLGEPISAALFLLVLGGTVVPRAVGASPVLDIVTGTSLVVAGWASHLDWYSAVPWLDLALHAVCTGVLAAVAELVLRRSVRVRGAAREGDAADDLAGARTRVETVLLVGGLGSVLAILWEVGEWAGHTFLDESIGVGYTDTVSDLVTGLAGSLVAGVLVARGAR